MWSSCASERVLNANARGDKTERDARASTLFWAWRQSRRAGRVVSSTLTIYLYRHPDTFQLNANYDVYITLVDFSSFCSRAVHDAVGMLLLLLLKRLINKKRFS